MENCIFQKIELTFEYPVHFTRHMFRIDNTVLVDTIAAKEPQKRHKVFFIVDNNVATTHPHLSMEIEQYTKHYNQKIQLMASPILVPGGEETKNQPQLIEKIQKHIHKLGICRHSYAIAIGGGAVLDMVGFACATPHRGVRLIRVPTTVLAQNDSGVGVKNAVNAFVKKNFLGTFAPPFAVINDSAFLETLDTRDWRAGIAEAVKVALIKDSAFFAYLRKNSQALAECNSKVMSYVIYRCAQLHLEHIRTCGDPFELGYARPLDFGHWSAHKLEAMTDYQLRHGEAVACGIALDSFYSYAKGFITEKELEQIVALLESLGFTLYQPQMQDPELLNGLIEFREHLGGTLCITLLNGIGSKQEVHEMDQKIICKAMAYLKDRLR